MTTLRRSETRRILGRSRNATVIDHVEIVGNRIAVRIKTLGLTQEAAALRTGLTLRQLQRAINGQHPPRLQHAFALAMGLDTTIHDLFTIKVHHLRITSPPQ